MLNVVEQLDPAIWDLQARDLHRLLPGPTLAHFPGKRTPALFLSVLLHGNEDVGWEALRQVMRDYAEHQLPRALSVFIGNVAAARFGRRHLDGQPDFNRIWKSGESMEHRVAQQVLGIMRERGIFASIDLHNNTGLNPHYACVTRLDVRAMHLAALFSRNVVYFTQPDTVQAAAFAALGPAVTLECGKTGEASGTSHAQTYLHQCLELSQLRPDPVSPQEFDLFHTVARVRVPAALAINFSDETAPSAVPGIEFQAGLERLNFCELTPGLEFARTHGSFEAPPLEVLDETERDVFDAYFSLKEGCLRVTRPTIPAMLTRDVQIVRQDCLCYLMERYPLERLRYARAV